MHLSLKFLHHRALLMFSPLLWNCWASYFNISLFVSTASRSSAFCSTLLMFCSTTIFTSSIFTPIFDILSEPRFSFLLQILPNCSLQKRLSSPSFVAPVTSSGVTCSLTKAEVLSSTSKADLRGTASEKTPRTASELLVRMWSVPMTLSTVMLSRCPGVRLPLARTRETVSST